MPRMLSNAEMERFVADGFVAVRGALPGGVAARCRDVIWEQLAARGVDRHDRATWRSPVVRISCPEGGPFVEAGTAPALWETSTPASRPRTGGAPTSAHGIAGCSPCSCSPTCPT